MKIVINIQYELCFVLLWQVFEHSLISFLYVEAVGRVYPPSPPPPPLQKENEGLGWGGEELVPFFFFYH